MGARRAVRNLLATGLALAAALAAPVLAAADGSSYPNPATHAIRVPGSIGGIHLGETLVAARSAWGAGRGSCRDGSSGTIVCEYDDNRQRGVAYFAADGSPARVYLITVRAPISHKTGLAYFTGPLLRFKTKEGIGLGSTAASLKSAYPRARGDSLGFAVFGKAGAMGFETAKSKNYAFIEEIDLSAYGNHG